MSTVDNVRLTYLWNHRSQLKQQEWGDLYNLIQSILKSYPDAILSTLLYEKEDYVHDFFIQKVRDKKDNIIPSVNTISSRFVWTAFQRFLIDCLRKENPKNPEIKGETFKTISMDDMGDQFDPCGCMDIDISIMEEYGLTEEFIRQRSNAWLECQPHWVLIYLGLMYCCVDNNEPLIHFAKRYGIASYHYNARKLGTTTNPLPNTLIGQWLETDFGINLQQDHPEVLSDIMKILCDESKKRISFLQNAGVIHVHQNE